MVKVIALLLCAIWFPVEPTIDDIVARDSRKSGQIVTGRQGGYSVTTIDDKTDIMLDGKPIKADQIMRWMHARIWEDRRGVAIKIRLEKDPGCKP